MRTEGFRKLFILQVRNIKLFCCISDYRRYFRVMDVADLWKQVVFDLVI